MNIILRVDEQSGKWSIIRKQDEDEPSQAVAAGVVGRIDLKPRRYAIHVKSGRRAEIFVHSGNDALVENPAWLKNKRKPRYVKLSLDWNLATESPEEVAARVLSLLARQALEDVQAAAKVKVLMP